MTPEILSHLPLAFDLVDALSVAVVALTLVGLWRGRP
jgi:hypothetical protein